MNAGYRLTPRAEQGLLRIVLHVEDHFGQAVTARVLADIEAAFDLLAANPGVGHLREDITPDDSIRFWPVGPTLIAYRHRVSPIEVLFVERGERDWTRLLGRIDD